MRWCSRLARPRKWNKKENWSFALSSDALARCLVSLLCESFDALDEFKKDD